MQEGRSNCFGRGNDEGEVVLRCDFPKTPFHGQQNSVSLLCTCSERCFRTSFDFVVVRQGDRDKRALNMHILFQGDPRPAGVVSANLLSSMLSMSDRLSCFVYRIDGPIDYVSPPSIRNRFISDDGRGIDYDAIGKSSEFLQYIIHTWEMQKVNDEDSKDRIAEVIYCLVNVELFLYSIA